MKTNNIKIVLPKIQLKSEKKIAKVFPEFLIDKLPEFENTQEPEFPAPVAVSVILAILVVLLAVIAIDLLL